MSTQSRTRPKRYPPFWSKEDTAILKRYRETKDSKSGSHLSFKFKLLIESILTKYPSQFSIFENEENDFKQEFYYVMFKDVVPKVDLEKNPFAYIWSCAYHFLIATSKKLNTKYGTEFYLKDCYPEKEEDIYLRLPAESPYFSFENILLKRIRELLSKESGYKYFGIEELTMKLSEETNIPRITISNILKNMKI